VRLRSLLIVAFFALFFVLPSSTSILADWLWFGEVGYQSIFVTTVSAQWSIGAAAFLIALVWLAGHLRYALKAASSAPASFTTREGFTIVLPTRDQIRPLATAAAAIVAVLVGLYASSRWMTVLAWWYQQPFTTSDPLLDRNAGFYVFTLPFLDLVRGLALALVMLAAVGSGALYTFAGELALTPFGVRMGPSVRRHGALLAACAFVVLAVGAWLDQSRQLVSVSGIIQGASYADVHARMPAAIIIAGAAILSAILSLVYASGRARWAFPAAVAVYAVTTIGAGLYAAALQRFVVAPNEQAREAPYIEYNIAGTRHGFALDRIEERELSGDAVLTRADIERNRETVENVRLWDHQQLLETFGQIQEIRTYYDFISVDNDRYGIAGRSRQVMLSARELNPAALPNRTWINERLVFTHGHGITLGPVNQVTEEGLPVLFIRDLPPISTVDIPITQPSIYFGELSNEYVIVRTRAREFHYPKGDDNVYADYDGQGGIQLGSFLKKLLFAVHFRAYQILLSDDITTESRLMFDRQIRTRVAKIAPFLTYDNDPYPVVHEGRLFWIQDAYTTSSAFPYSTAAVGNINYIRNSVKAVVDAYQGSVVFYLAEPGDPIAQTLGRIFPELLRPLSDMPAELRRHVRYPEGIFQVQASVFSTYHMSNPAVFYNKEDQWEVPSIDRGTDSAQMQPYYTIMKLPGEERAEFIQMLPFTPRRRDNLASWMVARSDPEHYGQLLVFQFPKQKLIFGPRQVVARINQDQVISPQITLWSQQGSEVIQGTLMVIPIEESLLYVRPLYLRAQAGRIPELTRVIVAHQNQIVMERTLEAGLARLFGLPAPAAAEETEAGLSARAPGAPGAPATPGAPAPPDAPTTPGASDPELLAEARATYERALAAQRAGDWAKYGEEIRRLGELLRKMRP
jgi:uncharacterized membrane protein (UPF0182 family)